VSADQSNRKAVAGSMPAAEEREYRDIQREAARNHRDEGGCESRTSAERSQRVSEILANGVDNVNAAHGPAVYLLKGKSDPSARTNGCPRRFSSST
jgi:hypothetical protein